MTNLNPADMPALQMFLRDLVLETGVPQNELARRTGLTEKHVSEMMNGWSQGKLTAWQALLDAAGIHLPGHSSNPREDA